MFIRNFYNYFTISSKPKIYSTFSLSASITGFISGIYFSYLHRLPNNLD